MDQSGKTILRLRTENTRLREVAEATKLTPKQAHQAAMAMEYAATLNKPPEMYEFGDDYKNAHTALRRIAGFNENSS